MKKNDYQNLMEHIQPPAGLNDRVLQMIRQEAAGVGTRWKRTALRAAVCAACALALVLGVVLFLRDAKLRRGVRERLLAENRE